MKIFQTREVKKSLDDVNTYAFSPIVDLDILGDKGWELVSVTPITGRGLADFAGVTTDFLWVFKRLKE